VIAVGEDLAAPPAHAIAERGVDCPGRGDLEALHAQAERRLVLGLDEHMQVRSLDAHVNDAEPLAQRRRDRRTADRLCTSCGTASSPRLARPASPHAADDSP